MIIVWTGTGKSVTAVLRAISAGTLLVLSFDVSAVSAQESATVSPDTLTQGKITFPTGSVYDGELKNGRMHGQGKITYAKGGIYEGAFFEDKITGVGSFVYPNGDRYEGSFVDGQRHGDGNFWFGNGSEYEGNFANGEMSGRSPDIYLWRRL